MGIGFEWDDAKAASNERKHGVSFVEAAGAFGDPLSMTMADPIHSVGEHRFVLLGRSAAGSLLVVVHTAPDEERIRIISARVATRAERRAYEDG